MGLFDVVFQWPCGLTGEWAETAGNNNVQVTAGVGNSGGHVV